MKSKKSISLFLILLSLILNSCSKSDDKVTTSDNLSLVPIAKSQYDNSNFGIYKGVFVGSSGIIIVNINNDNTLKATLIINDITYNFTTNKTLQQNQETTINFVSGSDYLTFSVDKDGRNPNFTNLKIEGHPNAAINAAKETSTTLIKCYEGTYSGGSSGVFNVLIYGNSIKGLVENNSTNSIDIAEGEINNNEIIGDITSGATFSGTLNGNSFSGTWKNAQYNQIGTFTGKRTY